MLFWYKLSLKHYFDIRGRSGRIEFWNFTLSNVVINLIFNILFDFSDSIILNSFFQVTFIAFLLFIITPSITLHIRRLHDIGLTGCWLFLVFVPFVGWLILFILYLLDSQASDNKYGPNPNQQHLENYHNI